MKLVRVSRATKKAIDTEWQNTTVTFADIVSWVSRGGNVGIQAGEISDWICATDLDCKEAEQLAPTFLPETLLSRKGKQTPSVYVYRSPGLGFETFKDLNGDTLIDLKASNNGRGHMFVVAPSIHPDKGPYEWVGGFNPAAVAEVPREDLRAAAGMLAVAALIARNLPETGRHDLALALAGYLLRNGVSPEDVLKMLLAAWDLKNAPREGLRDVEASVRDTKARLDRNEPATGGRTLEELVPSMPARIAKFLGWERAEHRELRQHYERSDVGNAERFLDTYGEYVRSCPARKMWLYYDGARWVWDDGGKVLKLAQKTARNIHKDAAAEPDPAKQREISKFAIASQNTTRLTGMLTQAKPHATVRIEDLDSDPWAINCQNGTLDLRAGKLKPHDPADLITRIAPAEYDPEAQCPRFEQFLKEILVDSAVIAFLRRYAGYTLTGGTRERIFAILHGGGKNGKTTLVELLEDVLGDYAKGTDTETILMKKYQGVGNDVAALQGARFVFCSEVEHGRRLAESKVKQLTGRDTVTARFLFGEYFSFRPAFKLWLSTNNKPEIQGTDDAIWDRVRLIPFNQRFEGKRADGTLPEKLREELPGVFAWMVRGCLEWQEHGIGEPQSILSATKEYRAEMDALASFFEDACIIRKDLMTPATRLFGEYDDWAWKSGEKKETKKSFGMRLKERGFQNKKITSGKHKDRMGWFGIGLRAEHPDPEDSEDSLDSEDSDTQQPPDPPPDAPAAEDPPPAGSTDFAGETSGEDPGAEDSGTKNHKVRANNPRVNEGFGKRSASSASSATPPEDPARRLLEDPPEWLQKQLARYQAEPERFLKPTCAAIAEVAYNTVTRWKEAEPALKRWLEEVR